MKITEDIHIHTNLSSCAVYDATVENYLKQAKESGLKLIGFSNHLWDSKIPGTSNFYRGQNVEHVLKLREELPPTGEWNGIRVLFGCETEFTYENRLCLAEESMDLFDYILVPHSHTHMKAVVPREQTADLKMHAKYLMDSFMNLVNHPLSHRFTAIAHPFVPGTRYDIYNTVQSLIPNAYFKEAFCAAREKGIAIEINGSCLIYMPDEEISHCEYVRIYSIAKECGCKFIYGSDSHDWRTDRRIKTVEHFLKQCGIAESDYLTFLK